MTGETTTSLNARLTVDIRQERTRVVSSNLLNYGGSIDEGLPPKMRQPNFGRHTSASRNWSPPAGKSDSVAVEGSGSKSLLANTPDLNLADYQI